MPITYRLEIYIFRAQTDGPHVYVDRIVQGGDESYDPEKLLRKAIKDMQDPYWFDQGAVFSIVEPYTPGNFVLWTSESLNIDASDGIAGIDWVALEAEALAQMNRSWRMNFVTYTKENS